jgi:hypothetical protein
MVLEGTEQELIEGCQRGEREAFRKHKDKVYSIALRYAGDETVAMDIAQETFLRLFSRIRGFRGDPSGTSSPLFLDLRPGIRAKVSEAYFKRLCRYRATPRPHSGIRFATR